MPTAVNVRISRIGNLLTKAAFVNLLPPELVDDSVSIAQARDLFARFVDQVEIENHNFCNRICWFCPNSYIDRRSQLRLMTEELFTKILSELAEIDYDGNLTWSRYHEALADASIFRRITTARQLLPRATLVVISNGDYMDSTTLPKLESAGVDRLILDLYLPDGKERDRAAMAKGLRQFRRRTGLELEQTGPVNYAIASSRLKATLEIPCYTKDDISTRGGLVEVPKLATYRRRAVCLAPVRHVVIDYNGSGMLCCQTRSDAAEHANAIIGDLSRSDYGLFHMYRDLGAARRALLAPGEKSGACRSCDVRDDGPDRLARHDWIAKTADTIPGASKLVERMWRRTIRRRFV
jgi:Radical SAM superfamily